MLSVILMINNLKSDNMKSKYSKWYHPYKPASEFSKKVAYFSMEFAIHQSLKIYSGGLGFLAGSHMRQWF